jgi:hypothetical protein
VIYNFNPGWKFIREDVTNAEQVAFDDSKWSDISTPHTYNDVDSYTVIISHSGGDRGAWSGITSLLASAAILSAGGEELTMWPKLPEPTAVGAVRSAIAVHVTSWRWLGFCRRRHCA